METDIRLTGNDKVFPDGHIEPVEEIGVSGLYCFAHPDRVCRADCMSYTTQPAESPSLNEQQKHCLILVAIERLGRYSGAIMTLLKRGKEDSARVINPTSNPLGGTDAGKH